MTILANIARFQARPGRSAALADALLALVGPSRGEAGCLQYDVCQSVDDADTWLVLEQWRTDADFDAHMQTRYVRTFLARVDALCTDGVDLRGFRVASGAAPAGANRAHSAPCSLPGTRLLLNIAEGAPARRAPGHGRFFIHHTGASTLSTPTDPGARAARRLAPLLAAALLSWSHGAAALDPRVRLADYHRDSWTAKDGAPIEIRSMAQTPDGWLWLASDRGLYRFDGVRFERFEPAPGERLLRSPISQLHARPNGDVYIGYTRGGFTLLRQGRLTHLSLDERDSPVNAGTYNIAVDTDGSVWVAMLRGVRHWHDGRWSAGATAAGELRQADNIALDSNGQLWASDTRTLYRLDRASGRFTAVGAYGTGVGLISAPDGTLWHSNGEVLRKLAPPSPHHRGWRPPATSEIDMFDRDGNLWSVNCPHGVCVNRRLDVAAGERVAIDKAAAERLPDERASGSAIATALLEDREGNIWVANRSGLDRFRHNRVLRSDVPNDRRMYVLRDGTGQAWLHTRDERLRRLDGPASARQLPQTYQSAVASPDGTLVLAARAHIERWTAQGVEKIPYPPGSRYAELRTIQWTLLDDGEALWFQEPGMNFIRARSGEWRSVPYTPDLPAGGRIAAAGRPGELWFGYDGNMLVRHRGGQFRRYGPEQGLDVGTVQFIAAAANQVFVGGSTGAAVLVGERFVSLRAEAPEVMTQVFGFAVAPNGDRYLHGARGIVRIGADQWALLASHPERPLRYRLLDAADGYSGGATKGGHGLAIDAQGKLWFASTAGIGVIDTRADYTNRLPPPVYVTNLETADGPHAARGTPALPAGTSALRIDYTALSYTMPERVRFRYRLDGVDRDWVDAGNRRAAYYTNLGPGTHRFSVQAVNEDGVWSTAPATLAFVIAPTLTQSYWFIGLCAAALLAALYGLHRLRLRRQAARLVADMKTREQERERIARLLHDTFLQSLQGLTYAFQGIANTLPPHNDTRKRMESLLDSAQTVIVEGRDQVAALRGKAAPDLESQLRGIAGSLGATFPARFEFVAGGTPRALRPLVAEELHLFAREALFNAYRHAGASTITATITYGGTTLVLCIADDGRGIAPEVLAAGAAPGHWGLPGLYERAAAMGATLDVDSTPAQGTTVCLRVPAAAAYA